MRHLLNLKDLSTAEIQVILDKAAEIKANPRAFDQVLRGKSLAMLFQKTSTRTRVSFEVAMTELGGHGIYVDWRSSNFMLSGIEYEAAYLSRNVSCIMARLMRHDDLLTLMQGSQVPVINGCCEKFHPCQALTDVMTIREHFDGSLDKAHLVFVGVQNNVSNSMALICHKLGINLTLATPEVASDSESEDAEIRDIINASPTIRHTTDPGEAVQSADFVYTDTWIDMQYFNDPAHKAENEAKLEKMMPYQINGELLKNYKCRIMHDMPIHDGFEITDEMVRDPRSIIFSQAENRLHAQKGLLWWIYGEAGKLSES